MAYVCYLNELTHSNEFCTKIYTARKKEDKVGEYKYLLKVSTINID